MLTTAPATRSTTDAKPPSIVTRSPGIGAACSGAGAAGAASSAVTLSERVRRRQPANGSSATRQSRIGRRWSMRRGSPITFRASTGSTRGARFARAAGVMPPRAILAAATLGALAGCTQVDTPIATPLDLSPPPPAVLGGPGGNPEPVDPRFVGALSSYAAALRTLRGSRGSASVETYAQIWRALRLLADAIAVVP